MVPVPMRKVSVRLTVTHAGFEGGLTLLELLYKRTMAGELIGPDPYAPAECSRAGRVLAGRHGKPKPGTS